MQNNPVVSKLRYIYFIFPSPLAANITLHAEFKVQNLFISQFK